MGPNNRSENFSLKCVLKSPHSEADLGEAQFAWLNPPALFSLNNGALSLTTAPETDFWQRTFYGFQNANAPCFLTETTEDFTFSVKAAFQTGFLYDQCGLMLYIDDENWMKASVEYENEQFSRLGSVVTNLGYSDWATSDISSEIHEVWYRLHRSGQDFYLECSYNGRDFQQMRMFHLHQANCMVKVGVYACSPLESSFMAEFSEFFLEACCWPLPHNDDKGE